VKTDDARVDRSSLASGAGADAAAEATRERLLTLAQTTTGRTLTTRRALARLEGDVLVPAKLKRRG
jgi:hypothetical protein